MPRPGVDEDRQAPLVGEGEELLDRRLLEGEPLRTRMQLDAAGAEVEAALGLGDGVGSRIDAAEGDERVRRSRDGFEDVVVGRRIAVRLVHREGDGTGADRLEGVEQLVGLLPVAVGVVAAEVGVGVVEDGAVEQLLDRLPPRREGAIDGLEDRRR